MANDLIKMLLQAEIDKQSINNLQRQLNDVQKNIKPVNISVNTTGTQSVSKMTDALEKLENVTKKNLLLDLERMSNRYKNLVKPEDVSNIRSMINSLNHTDPKLGHNIDLIKVKMKEVSVGAEQSRRALDLANKSAMSFGEAMKQAAYKFSIWSAITASYYKLIREISSGIKFITEMDSAITEIGIVQNKNREQVSGLAKEYNSLAKEMKVLTSDITSGAVEFYRQGLSQEEVMKRLQTTTMYSKIANLDFKQSAELLTATVNSMGVSVERAADVFTYLGDATATGADEIGIGFSKTGGAAAALGLEFEKVASWIAVISSKTRESSESIGHSINTMLSRLSRITSTGFNEEDDTKLNDVAKALSSIGIALTDQEGNFRNFGTILDEIYSKWGKLDDQTRAYVANTIAGTRQQSRFYNLMSGYAESMDLYSQSLEAAGTAQSKFNLYLESNQATIDKFRTTMEGLWLSIIDSDSLMDVVRTATSFIETLDNMVQKFGTVGTALNFLIPLLGVKFVWAIRSAYIEIVKLQATGSMSAFMPTSKILGQIITQMLGLKVAAGGATVAVTGLTLATAGLTLGVGLLTYGIIKWAEKSREAKEAMANALDNSQKLNDEVKSLENLANKQEELSKIEKKSVEQKEELLKVQRELAKLHPELATGIDAEGNKIADNLEMTKQLTEEKRKLLEQELLVIKTTADSRLPQLRKELAQMQEDSDRIQKRLVNGDTVETEYIEGYAIQIDKTQELKDELLKLVNTQRDHYEEITKLENGVKSYNQILEENAERQKWATVEELRNQATKAKSTKQLEDIEEKLRKLGFTSDDVANILSGNIDLVKEKYKELDTQQIINLQTIETLDAVQKQAMLNMLESSRKATTQLIEDTKARIKAIQAEMMALVALSGGKATNTSVVAKKGEIDPKSGLLSSLSTVAQNQAIEANKELVKLEGNLKDIEKALANVSNIDTKPISGIRDGGSGTSKDEYSALADRYQKLNLFLDKNNVLLAKNKTLQELAGDDLSKKLPLMEEEIELNKQRQATLHELNNERRKEMLELEKTLSGKGFTFEGAGDNRIITNLDNIQGKTKEVEEQFKRYIELQSSLLPQASQEWWNLQNTIVGVTDNIDKLLEQHRELARQNYIKKMNDAYEKQQERLQALEKIQEAIVQIIRKRGEEEKKALDEAHQAEMDSLEERHNERKKKYAEELDEFRKLIQDKIDALDEQYEEEDYLEQLNKEREEANRIQAEIDVLSLDDSLTARNKVIELRKQLADQNEKIAKMQQKKERDELKKSLQDQLKNKEDQVKDIEKIADKSYENEKRRLEEDYRINKEYLDKKYSDEKVYAEARESIMRGQVEVAEGVFEDIYDAYQDFEDKFGKGMGILGDIIKNDFLDQLKLAQDAIDEMDYKASNLRKKYDSDYDPSDDEMDYDSPRPPRDDSGGSRDKGIYMSSSDFSNYRMYKYLYDLAKAAGDTASMKQMNQSAQAIRDKYGITSDKYSYNDLKNKHYSEVRFKKGGLTEKTGLHILDGEIGKPERVLSAEQTDSFDKLVYEDMPQIQNLLKSFEGLDIQKVLKNTVLSTVNLAIPKIPNITPRQGAILNIENFIRADNITKDSLPMLQKFENEALRRLNIELNKVGILRPSY